MIQKEILLKGISIILDLASSFILPMVSDKISETFDKKEQREIIKEEVARYMEAH